MRYKIMMYKKMVVALVERCLKDAFDFVVYSCKTKVENDFLYITFESFDNETKEQYTLIVTVSESGYFWGNAESYETGAKRYFSYHYSYGLVWDDEENLCGNDL